jgi:hypothetical protein
MGLPVRRRGALFDFSFSPTLAFFDGTGVFGSFSGSAASLGLFFALWRLGGSIVSSSCTTWGFFCTGRGTGRGRGTG